MTKFSRIENEIQTLEEVKNKVWIVIFTDLLSLLISFFTLIYAASSTNDAKWDSLYSSVTTHFRPYSSEDSFNRTLDLGYLQQIIRKSLSENSLAKSKLNIFEKDDLLHIDVNCPDIFQQFSPNLTPHGLEIIRLLAFALKNVSNSITLNASYYDDESLTADLTDRQKKQLLDQELTLLLMRSVSITDALKENGYKHKIHISLNIPKGENSLKFSSNLQRSKENVQLIIREERTKFSEGIK